MCIRDSFGLENECCQVCATAWRLSCLCPDMYNAIRLHSLGQPRFWSILSKEARRRAKQNESTGCQPQVAFRGYFPADAYFHLPSSCRNLCEPADLAHIPHRIADHIYDFRRVPGYTSVAEGVIATCDGVLQDRKRKHPQLSWIQ